jgi:predicted thioesterase
MELPVGTSAQIAMTVTDADTAIALGSGDVPVLGTPRVVALVEQATLAAIAEELPDASTTVGTAVELEHLAPTPVGRTVTAEATLTSVDGRRLAFDVIVMDRDTLAARGTVRRVIVDRERFIAGASS